MGTDVIGNSPNSAGGDAKAARELAAVLIDPKYTSFVKHLGSAIKDTKVRYFLGQALKDGIKKGTVKIRDYSGISDSFFPSQNEIDLTKSLGYIGQHPEQVPLILEGGPITAATFGGSPIVTTNGKYIIDGHHRWSEVQMLNPNAKIETVDLNVNEPEKALRLSQEVIASVTGKLNTAKVSKGKNIYKMSPQTIQKDLDTYFSPAFYEAFYHTQPSKFRTKKEVDDYISQNILHMRATQKPTTNISRGYMPQYEASDIPEIKSVLEGRLK